jgi:NADH pyrophosphatase NudC (nudix superfamily)
MSTVVVGIIIKKHPLSYLLVKSKKDFGEFSGYYYPPAGHLEKGENELEALKREINEELGVNLISAKKLNTYASDIKTQKTIWFIGEVDTYDFKIDYNELDDVDFFTQAEMKSMKIWPATKKVFEEHIF